MRWISAALVTTLVAVGAKTAATQDISTSITRLRAAEDWSRALLDLSLIGPKATAALAEIVRASIVTAEPDALVLAQALAELPGAAEAVPALLASVPLATPEVRDPLLHALGNCVLVAEGAELRDDIAAVLMKWAKAGLCYSPAADAPTFAWYEYVRLARCLSVRQGGVEAPDLLRYLEEVRQVRQIIAGFGGDTPPDQICNLGRFGQHGTREDIEAIAVLACALGPPGRPIAVELSEYLAHEQPRPGEVLVEHCAGIGEEPPVDLPGVRFPTRWQRDTWRFAAARAIFALDTDPDRRLHALRHLLHAPDTRTRIDALAAVRAWPAPWTVLAPELAACLSHAERVVVREALVTLGLADAETVATVPADALRRLIDGTDRELTALAQRVARGRSSDR